MFFFGRGEGGRPGDVLGLGPHNPIYNSFLGPPSVQNCFFCWLVHFSGQIIATSHDLTPNGGLVKEIPLFQGNLGW